jgi:prepilin peptidase CpaA
MTMTLIALLFAFPALMAFAAASDLITMTIPNTVSLALIASFAAFALWAGLPPLAIGLHLAAGMTVLVVTFSLFALGWIGGGDAKFAAATALWLGFGQLTEYLLVASVAGGALTFAVILLRGWPLPTFALGWSWLLRLRQEKAGVPYGIALAAAALAVYPQSEIWTVALAR